MSLFIFANKVFAYETVVTNEEILIREGFTREEVNSLSDNTKNRLVEQVNDGGFSYEIITMNESVSDEISVYGQIPDSNLSIIIASSDNKVQYGMIEEVKVVAYYDWIKKPVWRLQDPIVISWDHEKFEYKSGSFHSEDWYKRKDEEVLHRESNNFYDMNLDNIYWYADLKGYIPPNPDTLYGFGEIILKVKNPTKFIHTNFLLTYVHSIGEIELGLSLIGEIGITIPMTGNDQIATTTEYKYEYYYEIKPNYYGFEQQYFFYEKDKSYIINNELLINTSRLRTGYIENEYVVLSPRRENAGEAFLEMEFDTSIWRIDVDLTMWSGLEELGGNDSSSKIQYKNKYGIWVTSLDLINDVKLPTFRKYPKTISINFPEDTTNIRFISTSDAVGTRNKGRLCIGIMKIFVN